MSAITKEELVAKDIQYKVEQGIIESGYKLSERTVAKDYSISRGTARKALQRMEKEGLVIRKQAVGYFIDRPKQEPLLDFINSFSDKFSYLSLPDYFNKLKIFDCKIIDTDKELSEKLKVIIGTTFLLVSVSAQEKQSGCYTFCRIFLPVKKGFEISKDKIISKLTNNLNCAVKCNVTLNLDIADKASAMSLHLTIGSPLLMTSTIFSDKNSQTALLLEQYSDAKHSVSIKPSYVVNKKIGKQNEKTCL